MSPEPAPKHMGTLAIIAALPRELALLARELRVNRVSKGNGILVQSALAGVGHHPIVLVSAGIGPERVAVAVAAALVYGSVDAILSIGLAGACDPLLRPGSVLQASVVIDVQSGERFHADTQASSDIAPTGILATSPRIAGVNEKRRLYQSYGASAVDMESATVARLARAHGIPFAALKAISDEHDVDLTSISRFAHPAGHFRTGAFALHTAFRPHRWLSTASLGRNSKVALEHLTGAVHQLIAIRSSTKERKAQS